MGVGLGLRGSPHQDTVLKGESDFLLHGVNWGSYLSAAGVVGVSRAGGVLLGPTDTEMLVEPERGGSGGFSSSPSVDRGQWGIILGLLPSVK